MDHTMRFRQVPQELAWTPERIMVWAEVITGMTLDGGVVHALEAHQWQERRRRLAQFGGPLGSPSVPSSTRQLP